MNHARILKTLLMFLVIANIPSTSQVHAEPLPHVVSCVLSIGDVPVQDHLLVEAKIDGVLYAATYTKDGRFGYDPYFKIPADMPYTEDIEGGRDGDMVHIYLDGEEILEFTFESGRISNFVEDISSLFNDPPIAITETSLKGVVGYSVLLNASRSTDPNGGELTYSWSHNDGSTTTGEITSHTFYTVGEHITSLTVSDSQGLEDRIEITITVEPPPAPNGWTNSATEGGRQMKIATQEGETRVWLTTLDSTTVSVLLFDEIFLYNHLPAIHCENMFALICDQGKLVHPVYIETMIPESIMNFGAKVKLYTWHMGAWHSVELSGVIVIEDRAWVYLDATSLGEGIYLVGVDQSSSSPSVNEVAVTISGKSTKILARFDHPEPQYNAYLRLDDHLIVVNSIIQQEISFTIKDLQPGRHVVNVNGMKKEIMIHSDKNIYFLFSLSALPIALASIVLNKFS